MVAAGQLELGASSRWRRPVAARIVYAVVRLRAAIFDPPGYVAALVEDYNEETRLRGEEVACDWTYQRVRDLEQDELLELLDVAERELAERGIQPLGALSALGHLAGVRG